MGKVTKMTEFDLSELKPYNNNAKIHTENQVKMICDSIREFGFLSPILVDKDKNIIAGHGRVMAAEKLGFGSVPGIYVEGLTDAQRRAYILADNRLTELGKWDLGLIEEELTDLKISGFNIELTGFELPEDWFETREKFDTDRQDGNEEYNKFLDKFEIKKTTDDCYTPDEVYSAVAGYVAKTYNVNEKDFIRPFYPGGDYENEKYPKGCIVVDNPPFSILAEILKFYRDRKIRFFLFAPTLTLFSSSSSTALPCGVGVTYENGACVNTSFLTNLEDESIRVKTCPELYQIVAEADEKVRKEMRREIPKYSYPDEVITSAMCAKYSKYGIEFQVSKAESRSIDSLDSQKEKGKAIYGKGYLLSERAAAERAAAERWILSDREKEIVRELSNAE